MATTTENDTTDFSDFEDRVDDAADRLRVVVGIAFKDKTDDYGTTTERIHTVSI